MPRQYFRPVVSCDVARPVGAHAVAGGRGWFTHVEVIARGKPPGIIAASEVPETAIAPLIAPRPTILGMTWDRPVIMGIVNTTPDSFSDGGLHAAAADAIAAGLSMADAGADVLDIGGESTRPGARLVDPAEEIRRVVPVITGLRAQGFTGAISIDTRKSDVASAALDAGADLINDVSGFTFDPSLATVAATAGAPVCIMHGPVDPSVMHKDPRYDDVLLDVYDFLEARIAALISAGVPRGSIIVDPGIGFAKTQDHNLALLARLSLLHGLGIPLLLGASRKRFIGTIGQTPDARKRAPGSIAVALGGLAQNVQMVRVHDVAETRQAIALWRAMHEDVPTFSD
ncbi:dihydropteroate synthase [uncultured Sulfitobacter sp.]|uniref:dihydropteroate synthase n=1 Tax=uncultured Sulfitobacter sp. TaxID=191468 RepID=UPI00263635D7|nr:dihydropteroate synthase [uncultured Sulfitobacter sp.]